jgi:hypothetical protein
MTIFARRLGDRCQSTEEKYVRKPAVATITAKRVGKADPSKVIVTFEPVGGDKARSTNGTKTMNFERKGRPLMPRAIPALLLAIGLATLGVTTVAQALPTPPEGRAYEMVSPLDKGRIGVDLNTRPMAAVDGEAISYSSAGAFAGAESVALRSSYVARRAATGWTTQGINAPIDSSAYLLLRYPQFNAFSTDLSRAVLMTADPPLAPNAPPHVGNLYVGTPTTRDYQLVTPRGPDPSQPFAGFYRPAFAAATPELDHILFESSAQVTGDAPLGVTSVFEWTAATGTRLASVLPDGQPAPNGATAGAGGYTEGRGTMSDDGRRLFFSADGQIYLRQDGTSTIRISASQRIVPDTPQPATFLMATADGSHVFFKSAEKLTDDSTSDGIGQDLYRYDVASGDLQDLSLDGEAGDGLGAGVLGMLGMSDDGSAVYFAAGGQLVPGHAFAAPDMGVYRWHDGQLTYVTTTDDAYFGFDNSQPRASEFVSDDGRIAVIASRKSPLGYDSAGYREFYVYDATDDTLTCASCLPDGTPPTGDASAHEATAYPGTQNRIRNLSSDGRRLVFDSSDPLVPEDTNKKYDVYLWEGGKVRVISTGTANADSYFADASVSGRDIFFITNQQLVAGDADQLVDLYDAREGGGFPAAGPAATDDDCRGDDCQGAPTPNPALPASATATFTGSGSATPDTPRGGTSKVTVAKQVIGRSTATLSVKVPGRGRLAWSGASLKRSSKAVAAKGTATVKVALTRRGRALLTRKRSLTTKVKVTFTSGDRPSSSTTVTLKFKLASAKKGR